MTTTEKPAPDDGHKNADETTNETDRQDDRQLLHLVFGGELTDLEGVHFSDLAKLDIVGIYPNYADAYVAWKAVAQQTVDNAHMRYFIVHMHRLLDPADS